MQNISNAGDDLDKAAQRMNELLLQLGRLRGLGGLRNPLTEDVEPLGLTPPQIHALCWLGTDGPIAMGELARRGGITEKTITGIVDRLERAGLVQRERGEQDRRVVRARLTRKGQAIFAKMRAHADEKLRLFLGMLDEQDRQAMLRILEKLCARSDGAA